MNAWLRCFQPCYFFQLLLVFMVWLTCVCASQSSQAIQTSSYCLYDMWRCFWVKPYKILCCLYGMIDLWRCSSACKAFQGSICCPQYHWPVTVLLSQVELLSVNCPFASSWLDWSLPMLFKPSYATYRDHLLFMVWLTCDYASVSSCAVQCPFSSSFLNWPVMVLSAQPCCTETFTFDSMSLRLYFSAGLRHTEIFSLIMVWFTCDLLVQLC